MNSLPPIPARVYFISFLDAEGKKDFFISEDKERCKDLLKKEIAKKLK